MKDIEVNGAHITDESAEILTQWQTKTEPVSACYIEVIEDLIDFLIEKGGVKKDSIITYDEKRHRKVV